MNELKKQFKLILFEEEILISTPGNRYTAFEADIQLQHGKQLQVLDMNSNARDWIETDECALNYYECCGVLILFGITPPGYSALCEMLRINSSKKINN